MVHVVPVVVVVARSARIVLLCGVCLAPETFKFRAVEWKSRHIILTSPSDGEACYVCIHKHDSF